jgi:DNA repair photolyase
LSRKKHKPKTVYFSTATDPFIPDRQVLDSQFQIMDMLLKNRIPLLISTKAKIPERFVELFSEHRDLVVVQIGQTTIDDRVRALMEPKAAPVSDRLRNIAVLAARNVTTELRMDPLIPWLTDTDRSLRALLLEAASRGCRQAVASFLHVRKANRAAMAVESGAWDFEKMRRHLYTETAKLGNDGCEMLLPSARYRRQRFDAISQMAEEFGIAVRFCGCKNPDMVLAENHAEPKKPAEPLSLNPGRHHDPVAEWLCHPWQASEPAQSGQLPLFY